MTSVSTTGTSTTSQAFVAPDPEDPGDGPPPEYDVFLAAMSVALEGTRFEATPFEDPELFAATGLLMCERIEAGINEDDVVFEYLTELTDGEAGSADDDQLVLAGALLGAATEALCREADPDQTG